jgi:hypothetical protein
VLTALELNHERLSGEQLMPMKEDILREKTFKEEGMETGKRVFYTLWDEKNLSLTAHRNSKLIGLLVHLLEERGVLNEADIDELLFDCIH